jgi:hypothetical protein
MSVILCRGLAALGAGAATLTATRRSTAVTEGVLLPPEKLNQPPGVAQSLSHWQAVSVNGTYHVRSNVQPRHAYCRCVSTQCWGSSCLLPLLGIVFSNVSFRDTIFTQITDDHCLTVLME